MAVRVSFALGSWQLVSLAAGLRDAAADGGSAFDDDVLMLYETAPASEGLRAAMRDVAVLAWGWRRIVEDFETFVGVPRRIGRADYARRSAALRARLGERRVDEVWLCWLSRPAEKLVLETFPEARVVYYEDGLTSYLPMPAVRERVALPRAAYARWPTLAVRRHKQRIAPRHARRVVESRMLLGDLWPAPEALAHVPWLGVRRQALRDTVAACARIASVRDFAAPPRGARPTVLVLGQVLSRWNALTRAQELGVYVEVVRRIVDRGYDIVWKEHPRAEQPFFDALAAVAPAGRVARLELPFALPVEFVVDRLGLAAVVAGISAALWYVPRLNGTPSYSFADLLAPYLHHPVWTSQNRLVLENAVPLAELPPAAA